MSVTNPIDVVDAYIDAVRARLADVPDEDRVDLLDDVASHVREIADEFGADQLETRLGTPEQFTEELRASAGYGPIEDDATQVAAPRVKRLRRLFNDYVHTDANLELWRKLEPGWFVMRGVVFAVVLGGLLHVSHLFGLVLVLAGAVASFKLGERRSSTQATWLRRLRRVAEAGLVLLALGFVTNGVHAGPQHSPFPEVKAFERDPCLRDSAGRAIGNLYAFDPSGQPIPQFFLTDQNGRPVDNLCPDQSPHNGNPVQTRYAHDANGAPVYGVFPRPQTETHITRSDTGVTMTTTPLAPPAVVFPQLAPPTTEAPAPPP